MYGKEACWNRYGTCQHHHVPQLAEQKHPGNVTVIPGKSKWTQFSYFPFISLILLSGLATNDAIRIPKCTRANSICKCRNPEGCDSGKYVYSDSLFSKYLSLNIPQLCKRQMVFLALYSEPC